MKTDKTATGNKPAAQRVLHFSVADNQFCVMLQYVTRVFPIVKLRYVPGAPKFLRGLMTLKGNSLPVIDLADRLGMRNRHQYHLETPILLFEKNEKLVGVIVDEVYGVEKVDSGNMQMQPLFDQGRAVPFEASIETKRGTSLLLNVDRIVNIDLASVVDDQPDDPRA